MHDLNPDNDLQLFIGIVEGDGPFIFKGKTVIMFHWIHSYYLRKANTFGLNATFQVLEPFITCILQCIIQNTGVPLGIICDSKEVFFIFFAF